MKRAVVKKSIAALLLGIFCFDVIFSVCAGVSPFALLAQSVQAELLPGTEVPLAGQGIYENGGSCIDASNAAKGIVAVKQSGVSGKLKVQIIKENSTYSYNLNNSGTYEQFPLQMGNGVYKVRIMKNIEGTKYVQTYATDISVTLENEFQPFLHASQYVNYSSSSASVKKAAQLCSGSKDDVAKVKAVYSFITGNISYDKTKASSVKTGYLPSADSTLSSKKGICFDYAALMASMLRSQGIPAKLVIGKVEPNDLSHAWNEVYIKGKGWVTVSFQSSGNAWERMDSTFGASKSKEMQKFIGNGSNYTGLRVY
jgi:hypothetical protein